MYLFAAGSWSINEVQVEAGGFTDWIFTEETGKDNNISNVQLKFALLTKNWFERSPLLNECNMCHLKDNMEHVRVMKS